ncbi:glycosyltransferase [bacterium]|nr:glycosyltransferase [bacterium]
MPNLTIIVVFFNMCREAERTLHTLSCAYQRGVNESDYDVIVIDNGSSKPLSAEVVENFGSNFSYYFYETDEKSPVVVINQAVAKLQTEFVMVMIDGAHMLSPGVVGNALRVTKAYPDPFVTVVGFHLGQENQNRSVSKGYNQKQEDVLLETVAWRENGYRLFEIAGALAYDCAGWFGPLAESNCFLLKKTTYERLGGFDVRFTEAGGGLAILDFFRIAMADVELDYVVLLGEGSFHQFHGGVASNAPYSEHPWERFHQQYLKIRQQSFQVIARRPVLLGKITPEADSWARLCARVGLDWWRNEEQKPHDMAKFFPTIGYAMLEARRDPEEERENSDLKSQVNSLTQICDAETQKRKECEAELLLLRKVANEPSILKGLLKKLGVKW